MDKSPLGSNKKLPMRVLAETYRTYKSPGSNNKLPMRVLAETYITYKSPLRQQQEAADESFSRDIYNI